MNISVRLSDEESELFKKYARLNNLTVSELIRRTIMERIEDEYDLEVYNEAMKEYEKDRTVYSHDEVKKMLLDGDE